MGGLGKHLFVFVNGVVFGCVGESLLKVRLVPHTHTKKLLANEI